VLFNKITISGWPKTNTDPQQPFAVGMIGDDVRGKKPNSQRQTDVCRAQLALSQIARFRFSGQPLLGATRRAREALRPAMFRQMLRTRFLIRKPGVERKAGHGGQ
jgi:hypothetical protein